MMRPLRVFGPGVRGPEKDSKQHHAAAPSDVSQLRCLYFAASMLRPQPPTSAACRAPGTLFPVPPGRSRKRGFPTRSPSPSPAALPPFTRTGKYPAGQIGNLTGEPESGASGPGRHSPPEYCASVTVPVTSMPCCVPTCLSVRTIWTESSFQGDVESAGTPEPPLQVPRSSAGNSPEPGVTVRGPGRRAGHFPCQRPSVQHWQELSPNQPTLDKLN